MDHFAGLDVSVKETSICIVDDAGMIVREVKVASDPVPDARFELRGYARASKAFALAHGPRKPGTHSFPKDRALELGEHAHHLKQRFARRRPSIEALLVQEQVDAERVY